MHAGRAGCPTGRPCPWAQPGKQRNHRQLARASTAGVHGACAGVLRGQLIPPATDRLHEIALAHRTKLRMAVLGFRYVGLPSSGSSPAATAACAKGHGTAAAAAANQGMGNLRCA